MSAVSLPYSVLILLVELAVGSLTMATVFDARRQVTAGYVKAAGLTIVPLSLLALWVEAGLGSPSELDGYVLRPGWLPPFRVALVIFLAFAIVHLFAAFAERHRIAVVAGAVGSVAGTAALVALAVLVSAPTWSDTGMILSVLTSAAVLGGALMAMMWGHWYLTSGRLPKEPMEQMSLVVLGALIVQAVLVVIGSAAAPRQVPLTEGFGIGLAQNPAYWLRIGVGLIFPAFLALLAWRAARIRGMMSATGLLYIALGTVLAGEVLARGILFSTGLAV